jgi:hypothetical protein
VTPSTSSAAYPGIGGRRQPLGQQPDRVDAPQVGLEQQIQRPLAGLAAGGHPGTRT